MASTGHLWRTTRLNTRKNSTRASVASVLRAERVRAAATGASALGIATDVELLGAGASAAIPRTKRVVAFSESVTVHILPACELEDAEFARTAPDGFCTTCQAYIQVDTNGTASHTDEPYGNPAMADDRMYNKMHAWKNAISPLKNSSSSSNLAASWVFLRNVDELESKNRHCLCDRSKYPEYGAGTDEVLLADDDDDSNGNSINHAHGTTHNVHHQELGPAIPPVEIDNPSPPPVQRERSLRFTSRSRARARDLALPPPPPPPPPGAEASMGVDEAQPPSPFPPLTLPVENLPRPVAENHPLPIALPLVRCTSTPGLELHSPKSDPADDEESDEMVHQQQTKRKKSSKKSKRQSKDGGTRIQPSLSEIRRQMLNEMELADPDDVAALDDKQICLNRRSRTLPAPVSRAPRPTPGRLSSLSDIDCSDSISNNDQHSYHKYHDEEPVNVDPRLRALMGVTSGAGSKQLSKLTPPQVSPSEDSSKGASRGPSFTRIFSDNHDSDNYEGETHGNGNGNSDDADAGRRGDKFSLPPSAVVVVPEATENKLSPSVYATKRKTAKHVISKETGGPSAQGGVGSSSYSISVSESSGLSAVSTPITSFEEEAVQGRLRFRSRRTRAAAAASTAAVSAEAAGVTGAQERANGAKAAAKNNGNNNSHSKEKERERSFAGFGGGGAREISGLSTTGTGFMERREEFSANSPRAGSGIGGSGYGHSNALTNGHGHHHNGARFSRAVRTDLGHLGHITAEQQRRHNAEKESLPRRLAGLRLLRERVSKLMGRKQHSNHNHNKDNRDMKPTTSMRMEDSNNHNNTHGHGHGHGHGQSVAEKLGRQLCLPHDDKAY